MKLLKKWYYSIKLSMLRTDIHHLEMYLIDRLCSDSMDKPLIEKKLELKRQKYVVARDKLLNLL